MTLLPKTRAEALRWFLLAGAAIALPTLVLGLTARTPSQRRIMLAAGLVLHTAFAASLFLMPIEGHDLTQGVLLTLTWFVALAAGAAIRHAAETQEPRPAAATSAAALSGAAICFCALLSASNAAELQAETTALAERHVAILAATFERATTHMTDYDRARIREELFLPAALKILRSDRTSGQAASR